jgi:hypothetical protein
MSQEVNDCSICLEKVNSACAKLDCGHEFHLKCWMELQIGGGASKRKCPNCRKLQDVPDVGAVVEPVGGVVPVNDWWPLENIIRLNRLRLRNMRARRSGGRSLRDKILRKAHMGSVYTADALCHKIRGAECYMVRSELNKLVILGKFNKSRNSRDGRIYDYRRVG